MLTPGRIYYQRPSTTFGPFKPVKYTHSIKERNRIDVYFQSIDHDPEKESPRIFHLSKEKFEKRYDTDV